MRLVRRCMRSLRSGLRVRPWFHVYLYVVLLQGGYSAVEGAWKVRKGLVRRFGPDFWKSSSSKANADEDKTWTYLKTHMYIAQVHLLCNLDQDLVAFIICGGYNVNSFKMISLE